jgi:hypothetical protein
MNLFPEIITKRCASFFVSNSRWHVNYQCPPRKLIITSIYSPVNKSSFYLLELHQIHLFSSPPLLSNENNIIRYHSLFLFLHPKICVTLVYSANMTPVRNVCPHHTVFMNRSNYNDLGSHCILKIESSKFLIVT